MKFHPLIQIARRLARQFCSVFKKAIGQNLPSPRLKVRSGEDGLFLEAQGINQALQRYDPHPQDREQMLTPLCLFADVRGATADPEL